MIASLWKKRVLLFSMLAVVCCAGYGIGYWLGPRSLRLEGAATPTPSEALPRVGKQLMLVYIGSSRCNPSNQSDVLEAVRRGIAMTRTQATQASMGFVTLGVARELNATSGLSHLGKIHEFDEISVGQGGLNQASMRYISSDHPGIGATPQVLLVERELQSLGESIDNVNVSERVVLRKVGAAEIARWVERGAVVPAIEKFPDQPQRSKL